MASASGEYDGALMHSAKFVMEASSLLSLQPWIFMAEDCCGEEKLKVNGYKYFKDKSASEIAPQNVRLGFGHHRSQNYLRSKQACGYPVKSVSLIEKCLISELYDDKFGFEEYVFATPPAPTTSVRPLVIMERRRITSRSNFQQQVGLPIEAVIKDEVDGVTSSSVSKRPGVSPRPRLRTPKRKSMEAQHGKFDNSSTRAPKASDSQDSLDMLHIFSLGLTIGVITATLSNRKEVKKLNDLLSSKENLVQDLQEELDMRESLTVNELYNGACCSQKLNDSNYERDKLHLNLLENHASDSYISTELKTAQTKMEISEIELRSKMEEELKAELERWDMDMNSSSLDGEMSILKEHDLDLVVDAVHGELKLDTLCNGAKVDDNYYSDSNSKSTSRNHTENPYYAVSPRELSLRLHELKQVRLEERIKELEQALQQTQSQLEAENKFSQRAFSSRDMRPSPNQESPTTSARESALSQAFSVNLHGDALDAYDEAYEEFMRIADEESLQMTSNNSNQSDHSLYSSDRSLLWGMEGENHYGKTPSCNKLYRVSSLDSLECNEKSDGVYKDEYDDECRMLIQQILEKTKHGTAAVLNARRMLLSMDN